jgi:hypothetical protein
MMKSELNESVCSKGGPQLAVKFVLIFRRRWRLPGPSGFLFDLPNELS